MTSQPKAITRYRLGVLTNAVLESRGLKTITPQQVYTFAKNGRVSTVRVGAQDLVTIEDAKAFIETYVAEREAKANGTDELLDELLSETAEAVA